MQADDPVANTQANTQATIRSPATSTQPEEILNVMDVMDGKTIATSQEESLLEQSRPEIIMNFVLARDPFATTQATSATQEEAQVAAQPVEIANDVQSGAPLITATATTSQPTTTTTSQTTTRPQQLFYPVGSNGLCLYGFSTPSCAHACLPQDFARGSGKCLNDKEAPEVARNNGHVYDDLRTCCKPPSWTRLVYHLGFAQILLFWQAKHITTSPTKLFSTV